MNHKELNKNNHPGFLIFSLKKGISWGWPVYLTTKLLSIFLNGWSAEIAGRKLLLEVILWPIAFFLFGATMWFYDKKKRD